MNLAKISANGQITVPVEIRRQLGLKSGDKILFLQNQNGEIVVSNASAAAIRKAQTAFEGAAKAMGVSSEDDIQKEKSYPKLIFSLQCSLSVNISIVKQLTT